MSVIATIAVAAVIAAAGLYYLLFSKAASRLGAIEAWDVNGRRQRLRRTNGGVLLVVAGLFAVGSLTDPHRHPWLFLVAWGTLIVLLAVVMSLATIDVRLTARLRRPKVRA